MCLPPITGPKQEKPPIHTGITTKKKNTSNAPIQIIVVEPDDNKTIITVGRIGANMRSAKERIVLQQQSPNNETNPRVPLQEGSRADRRGVHKTPRRPFSRGSLICIIIGHSGKPQHAEPIGHQDLRFSNRNAHTAAHVHDTTTARLTTNGAQCQNRTKHPTIQPSEKPQKSHGQTQKNKPHHNSKHLPLITRLKQENLDTDGPDNNNKDAFTAPKHTIMIEPMKTKR